MSSDEKPTLEAVLDYYDVQRRSSRSRGMAHCPLHEDRTPSLSYDLSKEVWRCHSCGEGGDSYTLIMRKEGVDYRGARTFASSINLATTSAGGGSEQLSGSAYGRRRKVPTRKGAHKGNSGYVPAWRRH